MSTFDQRWRRLAALSRQAGAPALPAAPQRRWPLRAAEVHRGERHGWWAVGVVTTIIWALALVCAPRVVALPAALGTSPVALARNLPPLPHPPSPGTLLAAAYSALLAPSRSSHDL